MTFKLVTNHEQVQFFLIHDLEIAVGSHRRVLVHHVLRLHQLLVDLGQLVDRRGDPQARHVCGDQLLVEGVAHYVRFEPPALAVQLILLVLFAAPIGTLPRRRYHNVVVSGEAALLLTERRRVEPRGSELRRLLVGAGKGAVEGHFVRGLVVVKSH